MLNGNYKELRDQKLFTVKALKLIDLNYLESMNLIF